MLGVALGESLVDRLINGSPPERKRRIVQARRERKTNAARMRATGSVDRLINDPSAFNAASAI